VVSAKADEKVSTLLDALARENVNLLDCNRSNYWTADLLAMCRDVAAGGLSAGVAIVPQAADAMLLAAKVKGVRPVQAAAPDGVAKALRSFGANLLILEPASSTYHQMRTMIRLLAAGGPAAEGSALLSALKELEG
jgi:ribose 5-phosphate isomerase RpiB